jgi:hypothetical protein
MIRRTFAAVLLLLAALGVATAQPLAAPQDPAHAQIAALIQESAALGLPARVEHALTLTLRAAQDAVINGQRSRARTLLRTFAFEVRGVRRAKRLPAGAADALIAKAVAAIGTLDTLYTWGQTPAKKCDDGFSVCSPSALPR